MLMKKFFGMALSCAVLLLALTACNSNNAQQAAPAPDNLSALKEILQVRKSIRQFDTTKVVSDEVMLDILWAANGINREDGRRTAPSAVNAQDIVMYVCQGDGTYLYRPAEEVLEKVSGTDIRPIFAGRNSFALNNPVIMLMSDYSKFSRFGAEAAAKFGAMDAGYVSQNIYMYCAAADMATVACAPGINQKAVQEALMLPETMISLIYHPVGYPAE